MPRQLQTLDDLLAQAEHYIDSTTDLERRFAQHRSGHAYSKKRLGDDLEIVASLEISTLEEARALEREMKRKKNPQLALYLLESRHGQVNR